MSVMSKSVEAFRTIGEVSDDLDVPKHVLRFWEGRFPQIKPMKRGGGRRFYRPEDVALLQGIHHLLHKAGYTIKGVQRILREQGAEAVKMPEGGGVPSAGAVPATAQSSAVAPAKKRADAKSVVKAAPSGLPADDAVLRSIAAELSACLALLRRPA
jgi:DNA-binding transcriptional MerR regulator